MSDSELLSCLTDIDLFERKHVATYLLESRRNQALTRAERSSAHAAWLAAFIAGMAAVVAFGHEEKDTKKPAQERVFLVSALYSRALKLAIGAQKGTRTPTTFVATTSR